MKGYDWLTLAGFVALCEGAGGLGTIFTAPAIDGWYAALAKPELAPPNWVFGPIWTTLFLLMGVAAFLVWRKGLKKKHVRAALGIFALQLALNVFWSALFFGLHNPGAAFAEIIVLWLSIAATIYLFARVSRPAAWLLVPYIVWVSVATYLNFMLFVLN